MKKIVLTQFVILLGGTLFAWFNFFTELNNWFNSRACTTGCSANIVNHFLTPCFYGAIFFSIAFILSIIILKRTEK